MFASGSSPLAVVRDGMWGFLLFAGVAWLAISWSVLRLEPVSIGQVAGPVVLFGALMEAVRALAGTRTWWLNAGMAALFAVTGVILLASPESSFTAPAALVGWFLMVRGAADMAMAMMTRESDRIWGLLLVVGVFEAGLGFFAASPFAQAADLMVVVLGALGLARGVADLVAALRLREAPRVSLLELPAERVAGVAGYTAGLTDFEAQPPVPAPSVAAEPAGGARHRAARRLSSAQAMEELSARGRQAGPPARRGTDLGPGWGADAASSASSPAGVSTAGPIGDAGSFHDEVLRTTADLDMMLALAGVTGAAVGAAMTEQWEMPVVPDTAEGVESAPGLGSVPGLGSAPGSGPGPAQGFEPAPGFEAMQGADSGHGLESAHGLDSAHGLESAHGLGSAHGMESAHGLGSAHGWESAHEQAAARGRD